MSNSPSTGNEQNADTTITITIAEVKEINKKLIERKYLLNIVATQDTIIDNQTKYIKEQERMVEDIKSALESKDVLHKKLLYKNGILKTTAIALTVALTVSLLFNFMK